MSRQLPALTASIGRVCRAGRAGVRGLTHSPDRLGYAQRGRPVAQARFASPQPALRTLRGYPVVATLYPFRGVNDLLGRPYRVGHSAQDPLCSPPAMLFGPPTHGALRFSASVIFPALFSARFADLAPPETPQQTAPGSPPPRGRQHDVATQ